MGWSKQASKTTRHTCGGPVFGRKTPGCPRCDELLNGAAPVVWAGTSNARCACGQPAQAGYMIPVCRRCELREHFASERHRSGGCGPVCTFGDW